MSLAGVVGRSYGPFPVPVTRTRAADLVAATGDDPDRWAGCAPPSYAAVPLFVAAPAFFADPDVVPYAGAPIHADQRFEWAAPFRFGAELEVGGTVESVRARGGMNFVSFVVEVTDATDTVLTAWSTFVMSAAGSPPDDVAGEPEPPAGAKSADERAAPVPLPEAGGSLPPLAKSASRADLVRYAAATGDFNPIHWDHDSARAAGLPGVIAHGLLMGAWAMQAAGRASTDAEVPLSALKLRFRRFLRPSRAAVVTATVAGVEAGTARLDVAVTVDGAALVTGAADVVVGAS